METDEKFILDAALSADTLPIGALQLCRVTLRNDARFPWVILVPQREGVTEIIDLDEADRRLLMQEISQVSTALREICKLDKLNVASLGNIVPQLHVHVIARFKTDAAWPNPVWGHGVAEVYEERQYKGLVMKLRQNIGL